MDDRRFVVFGLITCIAEDFITASVALEASWAWVMTGHTETRSMITTLKRKPTCMQVHRRSFWPDAQGIQDRICTLEFVYDS